MKDELLEKICDIFSIPHIRKENGAIETEIDDAIFYYNQYNKILTEQIENKEKLIALLKGKGDSADTEQVLRKNEELYLLQNELYQLHVKYLSNNDYIQNYEFHKNKNVKTK